MSRTRILVVDDEPHMTRAVRRALMRDFVVVEAATPEEAVRVCQDEPPDMAILDITMPLMNGFDLMDRLLAVQPSLDVIFMTGSLDPDNVHMVQAIRKGAFYYIQKPFQNELLSTLVQRCQELRETRRQLERRTAHQEKQLAAARAFQLRMLPPERMRCGPLHVRVYYRSCHEVGGDLCDYQRCPSREGDVAMLLADIAGKGAGAAMLTSTIRYAFRTAGAEDFAPIVVNQRMLESIPDVETHYYATAVCLRVSPREQYLDYVSAGHNPVILVRSSGERRDLESTGPPLSPALIGQRWQERRVVFEPGDRLLVYSDGVVETVNDRREMFDSTRVYGALADARDPGSSLIDAVLARLRTFQGSEPAADDVSMVEVRFEA